LKDGWANYPGEVSRYKDRYSDQDDKVEKNEAETVKDPRWNKWDKDTDEIELPTKEAKLLKSKTQIMMIWKEKKKATSPTQKEQTSEPLAGSDDTPDK
jgi:predicted nuclease with TOPRIM domain